MDAKWLAVLVLAVLFVFGVFYNWLVAELEKRGWHDGYIAYIVAAGCGATLAGLAVLDVILPNINAGLLGLMAFAASGAPMIVGSMMRHMTERAKAARVWRDVSTQATSIRESQQRD